jgi:hypothetical protein
MYLASTNCSTLHPYCYYLPRVPQDKPCLALRFQLQIQQPPDESLRAALPVFALPSELWIAPTVDLAVCPLVLPHIRAHRLSARLHLHVCAATSRQNASRQRRQLRAGHRGEHNNIKTMRDHLKYSCECPLVHTRSTLPSFIYANTGCQHAIPIP